MRSTTGCWCGRPRPRRPRTAATNAAVVDLLDRSSTSRSADRMSLSVVSCAVALSRVTTSCHPSHYHLTFAGDSSTPLRHALRRGASTAPRAGTRTRGGAAGNDTESFGQHCPVSATLVHEPRHAQPIVAARLVDGAAVVRSGHATDMGLRTRRGCPKLPDGDRRRLDVRNVLVGRGLGARPLSQRSISTIQSPTALGSPKPTRPSSTRRRWPSRPVRLIGRSSMRWPSATRLYHSRHADALSTRRTQTR